MTTRTLRKTILTITPPFRRLNLFNVVESFGRKVVEPQPQTWLLRAPVRDACSVQLRYFSEERLPNGWWPRRENQSCGKSKCFTYSADAAGRTGNDITDEEPKRD